MFLIVPNLLELSMCSNLINSYQKNINLAHKWRDTYPLLVKPTKDYLDIFCRFFNNYIDRMEIVIWPENSYQEKHFDEYPYNNYQSGLASITYLNDDYEGGQTCIVDQKLCVNPKTGTTFYFDGRKYEHEVKPVKNGTRYTLAIWYTDHEDFDWQKVRENELNDMYSDKYSDMYRIV